MTYFLFFSSITLGFLFKKSKAVSAYILSAMYLLAAFNYYNADYYSYTLSYANAAGYRFNFRYIGYSMFVHFFSSRGITYSQYLKIAFVPIFLILFVTICILTDRPNPVLALFLVFPFGIDVIQLKAFYSEMFGLLGIALLLDGITKELKHNPNYRYVLSVVFFALSVLFHFSGLFYFLAALLFCLFRNKQWFSKAICLMSIVGLGAVLSGVLGKVMSIAGSLGVISEVEYLSSFASRSTRFGFILTFIPVVLMVSASWLIIQPSSDNINDRKQQIIRQFMLTGLLILPLLVMHIVYDRLARIYLILMYSLFADVPKPNRVTIKQFLAYTMCFLAIVCFFFIDIYPSLEGTLLAILDNSELFDLSLYTCFSICL